MTQQNDGDAKAIEHGEARAILDEGLFTMWKVSRLSLYIAQQAARDAELAAANARAGRLEEAEQSLRSDLDILLQRAEATGKGVLSNVREDYTYAPQLRADADALLRSSAVVRLKLSTAPQVSTERCLHRVNSLGHCMRCGARPYDKPIVQASTEQASPSPAVGEGPAICGGCDTHVHDCGPALWSQGKKCCPDCTHEPAQPAPGGAERCRAEAVDISSPTRCMLPLGHDGLHDDGVIRWNNPAPAEPQGWLAEGLREAVNASPEMKAHVAAHPSGFLPAEPQGRTEQAGDRPPGSRAVPVYLSEDGVSLAIPGGAFTTIRACRHCGALITGGPTACVHCVRTANRLEGK